MDEQWLIELLGGLRASRGDTTVSRFRTQKTAALLAYLALHPGRPHPRDTLVDLLWPDDPLSTGRNKLRQALTSLRYQLEPPGTLKGALLQADRAAVQLNPLAFATDVARLETRLQQAARAPGATERAHHLIQAVELYRGELLPGHFDPWVLAERQRLQEAYLAALGQLVTLLEDMGEPEQARDYAWRGVRVDPLREEGQHSLIRLLLRLGETGAARRQYQEWERLLEAELGEEPAKETQALLAGAEREGSSGSGPTERWVSGDQPHAADGRAGGGRETVAPEKETAPHPTGTVTFLFAEIVGTTASSGHATAGAAPGTGGVSPELLAAPPSSGQADLMELLRPLFRGHGGHELRATDQAISVAFGRASDALHAALAAGETIARLQWAQSGSEIARGAWPPNGGHERGPTAADARIPQLQHQAYRLRAALHMGEVEPGEEITSSQLLPHTRQIMLAAHPGQILLSERCAVLLQGHQPDGVLFHDLGRYRLTDQSAPERFYLASESQQAQERFPPLQALPEHTGNLPLLLTRFFGRSSEVALLHDLLLPMAPDGGVSPELPPSRSAPLPDAARLVTLTGPGGSGKSRLALEAVHRLRAAYHGAVWFVPLVDLSDARLLPDRILDALRLPPSPHHDPLEQAAHFLARQPSLLLVDNLEHLLPAAASLLHDLMDRTPTLTLLVTSRQSLLIEGERELPVVPLPVPVIDERLSSSHVSSPEDLIDCASVALFVDRARAARPDFQVTPANARAIARLCARLEGLPLAIELAAARVGVLKPAQILARLEQRFELLVSRQRDVSARHQSLRAALDWSYQLLAPELQRCFAGLSVFRGGWTLDAAEAVCLPDPTGGELTAGTAIAPTLRDRPVLSPAADYLEQLRQCSLVVVDEEFGEVRFRLLETLREFGAEQLGVDEAADLRRRHAAYFVAWAEQIEAEFMSPRQPELIRQINHELSNIRAALGSAIETGDADAGLRLVASLKHFWHIRGLWEEGGQWLLQLLEMPAAQLPTPTRAKALEVMAALAYHNGEIAAAEQYARESVDTARGLNDRLNLANSLNLLGDVIILTTGPTHAEPYFEESLRLHREIGDVWGTAISLNNLAMVKLRRADYDGAEALYHESLALHRQSGDPRGIASVLGALGTLAQRAGQYQVARDLYHGALSIQHELGYRRGVAWMLNHLGSIAVDEGNLHAARGYFDQSLAICHTEEIKWGIGWALVCLADICRLDGNFEEARSLYEQALREHQELANRSSIAKTLNGLGLTILKTGDLAKARALCQQSLTIRQELEEQNGIVECLEALAQVLVASGEVDRAARLISAAEAQRHASKAPLPPSEQPHRQAVIDAARMDLGDAGYQAAAAVGEALPLSEAVALALSPV
jgi:predicted ATPase/DNA-binding SARP family transcriptional activator